MNLRFRFTQLLLLFAFESGSHARAEGSLALVPGHVFTVQLPEMPATFHARMEKRPIGAQMAVFLPRNYETGRRFPLLVFLNGGDGGDAANPGVARALTTERDFICVIMPLFKASDPAAPGGYIMNAADAQLMWPLFQAMMARLEQVVPNIDPVRRVMGGFSNGAHATQGLLDASGGELAHRFAAFFFVEGGGRLQHYEFLKGHPFLMVSSNAKSRPRASEICEDALAAGATATRLVVDVGRHDFPASAYPDVRAWLRGPALE